ncbi:MAG TPA: hypothetical protein H9867_01255 [Candidatus Corynebacterium gallistercoris]|uniref:Enterochelin esterase n=1 Tax=Candidatus Corynebacterium gallistercoris TaxID=2838530 RepID=A0A9D1RYQ4_9CORY|nr:hypothetical protein [Candidatus Corynebacterium gallistercoris]
MVATVELPEGAMGSFMVAPVPPEVAAQIESSADTRQRFLLLAEHTIDTADPALTVDPAAEIAPAAGARESGRIILPSAPPRPGWEAVPCAPPRSPEAAGWTRHQVADRTVWRAGRPGGFLLILFDATTWTATHLPQVLDTLHGRGDIPACEIVAVETHQDRARTLGCSEEFARWVAVDLLEQFPSYSPEQVVVAGQSLGGVSAVNVARLYPDHVGGVVANSPSFWWPTRGVAVGGNMLRFLKKPGAVENIAKSGVRIFLSAGTAEGGGAVTGDEESSAMVADAQAVAGVLENGGVDVHVDISIAAHEMAAWEGALTRGLVWVLGTGE